MPPNSPAAVGSTPPPRSASATCAVASSCSTSGPSAASTACTSSTSCVRSRRQYADELVVIGVHSPKFVHEADPDALAAAVERYGVHHPVLDDPDLTTWQAYTARAWPTLVLIDPEGYVVAHYAGEGHAHAISALLATLVDGAPRPRAPCSRATRPTCRPSSSRPTSASRPRRCRSRDGRVLVADAGHDAVVLLAADGSVERRFDGFREPNGLCLVPAALGLDYDVVVADTVGHRLAGLSLVHRRGDHAGRRRPAVVRRRRHRPAQQPVGRRVVAGPGVDRDGRRAPALDLRPAHRRRSTSPPGPPTRGCSTGRSTRRGSPRPAGSPSTATGCGWPTPRPRRCATSRTAPVHTAVGTGLFDFGFRDGPAERGAPPAPARRRRAARRLGRGRRHLQRCRPPLRRRRADHHRQRPGRAERPVRRRLRPRRRRVRRPPAHPDPARRPRSPPTTSATPRSDR